MAITSSWISHIETFVDISRSSNEQTASRNAIALLLQNDVLTMEALVKGMGLYLTSTDHLIRGRGIILLAELLVSLAPKPLENTTIHSLTAFFTEKLADWQALHGVLIGCLALLRRESKVGMVTVSDMRSLAQSYVQNIQVQSLGKADRKLCFEILNCLLDHHPDVIASLGDDLIYGICEAIDGEKDPECLILIFQIIADLFRVFPDPFGPLAGFVGDLFEILGCYFPIHFTHPNDDFVVKREDLSRALMLTFASTSLFEPFVIPLLLEKLSSSLLSAKADSLKYLTHCSVKYGADIMAKHAKAIWSSLKYAIFSSSQEPILSRISGSIDEMDFPHNEVAKEALQCVQKFMLQEDGLFLSLILEDDEIEQILRSSTCIRSYNDISEELSQKLCALGCILSATARVSTACCNKVFQRFFVQLVDAIGIPDKWSDDKFCISENLNFGALYMCIELLVASRSLALSYEELPSGSTHVERTWCCLLKKYSGPLMEVFQYILVTSTTQDIHEAYIYSGVAGLQILATHPQCSFPISESAFEYILTTFTTILTSSCERKLLWKLTLKALKEIGSSIERFHDCEKALTFKNIVVENVVSLISLDYSAMPLPQRLEALSVIGTSGLAFMLRVTQGLEAAISANFLEASVKGNPMSIEALVSLLECYSSKVLPWYERSGGFEDVASRFSVNIWNQIECYHSFSFGDNGKELLNTMMTTMKLAVAGCSEGTQDLIVQKAYDVLSSSKFFLLKESLECSIPTKLDGLRLVQGLKALSSREEWIICLFASVIMALRPKTPVKNMKFILMLFTSVLPKGNVSVGQGLGSIINKLPSKEDSLDVSSICTVEEAMDLVLNIGLRCSTPKKCGVINGEDLKTSVNISECDVVLSNFVVGLSWIGKGLVMRGNERVKDVITMIFGCLLSSKLRSSLLGQDDSQDCCEQVMHPLVMRSAADAFHVLLSDSDICLSKKFHATMRPLYKQRFYSSIMPTLLTSLKECDSSTTRSMIYRAIGNVISSTPLAVVLSEAKKLIIVLLDGISTLSVDVPDKDLTYSLLLVLSAMIMDENGREAITENAHIIINQLIGLVFYPHKMLVRETAIQCLVAMSGLPYTRIFSMKTQVVQAVSKALDDPKRIVRLEAVRCLQAWASTASRSVHF